MTNATTVELHHDLRREAMPLGHALRAYLVEAKYESVRMLRTLSFAAIFLPLPVLLYLLFAVLLYGNAPRSNTNAALAVFSGFAVFGIIGPAMFGFGVTVAIEREQGLLRLKRALPMPSAAYLVAKMLMAMLFAAIITSSMEIAALSLAHLPLTMSRCFATAFINIFGVLPFCAIGLFIGTIAKGAAAPGLTHLIYLPMIYLSGLFFPLPKIMQAIAPVWPAYHLNLLVLAAAGAPSSNSVLTHIAILSAVTLLFAWLALQRLRRTA